MSDTPVLSAHEYHVRIAGLIERRRYDQAGALLGDALAAFPHDPDLLYQAASLEWHRDDYDAALQTLQGALCISPEHAQSRMLLVAVHEGRNDLAAAEDVLLGLLRDYPQSAMLFARYSLLMYRAHQIDKARELAREALRLDPEDESALRATMMGDLIDGRARDERASLAALMHKHPEDYTTAHMLVLHLIGRGRYWAAKRIAVELLKAQPDSREVLTLVVELETLCHWSMLPLWPLNRWGTGATIALWVSWMALFKLTRTYVPAASGVVTLSVLGFCVYSWVYPPLLRRWLKRRAGL